jgi:hypothetical protein
MSQSVGLEIVVLGMAGLIASVVECGFELVESRQTLTDDAGVKHTVDAVVTDKAGAKVGVKLDAKTQVATFVPQDCKGGRGLSLARQISQRYARTQVLAELRSKGYEIGKEVKQADGSVKIVASRWR